MKTYISYVSALLMLPLAFAITGCSKARPELLSEAIHVRVSSGGMSTKATEFKTKDLQTSGWFIMDAYVDQTYTDFSTGTVYNDQHLIKSNGGRNVRYASGEWSIQPETNWVGNVKTRFWCYAPYVLTTASTPAIRTVDEPASPDAEEISFSYSRQGSATLPLISDGSLRNSEYADADVMNDLVFGYAEQQFTGSNNTVDIRFFHALSQIRFSVCLEDGTFDKTLEIVQIALKDVYQGGQCTFHGKAENIEDKFTWEHVSTYKTCYCQTYNATFTEEPANWEANVKNSKNLYTASNTFMVVPQALKDSGVKMVIVFKDRDALIEREFNLDSFSSDADAYSWKPGYYYNYKIGATVLGRTIKAEINLLDWQNFDDKIFIN